MRLPHPIPYQGSKRRLAPIISNYIPRTLDTWYEPFAGSGAMSIWLAHHRDPKRIVIGESLNALAELWKLILTAPEKAADRYEEIWKLQLEKDITYFYCVRDRFNTENDPVDLLYLLCRCVKNAVRFNSKGNFTQSVDKRRLGMQPNKMRNSILGASELLSGITEVRAGDWLKTTSDASPNDFIYMDPPYRGTSMGRDRRYAEWMSQERLITGLERMRGDQLRFALSYDGRCGEKIYGSPLPDNLMLTHLMIHAGRSTQATLNGSSDETYESLYLSHGLTGGTAMGIRHRTMKTERLEMFAA